MPKPSKSKTTTATEILIDVETEYTKRKEIQQLFGEKQFFIPERYYLQMAKTGLLDKLVSLVRQQTVRIELMKKMLSKHPICIPTEYYSVILENNLLTPLLEAFHMVNLNKDLARVQLLESTLSGPKKRRHDDDDNSNHNSSSSSSDKEDANITTQRTTKRKRTSVQNRSEDFVFLYSPPSTTDSSGEN